MVTARQISIRILNFVYGIIVFFIGMKFVLRLLAANPTTPFVLWIYKIANIFVGPFIGMFQSLSLRENSVLDVDVIIALIVYTVLFYAIFGIIDGVAHIFIRSESSLANRQGEMRHINA